LIERNERIYNGEFIFVPRELEFSIKYLLEWYYRNRHETLLDLAGERELPTFYLYNNQFQFFENHVIQKSHEVRPTHVYNDLYLFSFDELMDPSLLEEQKIYFHYDMANIRQFFIVPFSPENRNMTISYIATILSEYNKTDHMYFQPEKIDSTKEIDVEHVILKEKDNYYFVFYSF
jgi:hypothetical protein